jgi:phosphoglycerate kinase
MAARAKGKLPRRSPTTKDWARAHMAGFLTLDDIDPSGKTALLRADLNVPVRDGKVIDATRIARFAPTIEELLRKGARVVVMSHFGRPERPDPSLSLKQIEPTLSEALGGRAIAFARECVGPEARAVVKGLAPDGVALLENLRFDPREEKNDPAFARELASLGDIYVNDAFSVSHRAHASIEAIAHLLPAVAGRLMQAELEALAAALETPVHPVMAIVAGAKVSTKLDLLNFLMAKVDVLAIGGAMANTLLKAKGFEVGASLVEREMNGTAKRILDNAAARRVELMLPADAVVAAALEPGVPCETVAIEHVPADRMILDLGPRSVAQVRAAMRKSRTLLWNGPVGAFETAPFERATVALAREAAALTRAGQLMSIAGGGDTVAALAAADVVDCLSYVSTAGGAFLEFIEGRKLPGVAALTTRRR